MKKTISHFFGKFEKKVFPQKKKGSQEGGIPTIFSARSDLGFYIFFTTLSSKFIFSNLIQPVAANDEQNVLSVAETTNESSWMMASMKSEQSNNIQVSNAPNNVKMTKNSSAVISNTNRSIVKQKNMKPPMKKVNFIFV